MALAQLKLDLGRAWQGAVEFQYLYQNQMFDASTAEIISSPVKALGHRLSVRPSLRRDLGRGFFAELGLGLSRQYFKAPLDNNWEAGPKIVLGRSYGHQSEITLCYEIFSRPYDDRVQASADGRAIPGEALTLRQQEVALQWRHYWDARRHWRTTTKLSAIENNDNGSGYYDYTRYQLSQQVRYHAKTWEVKAQAKISQYDYAVQTVSTTDLSHRNKTLLLFNVRGEIQLIRSLTCFAEYEHERALANVDFDEYEVHTMSGGINWEF